MTPIQWVLITSPITGFKTGFTNSMSFSRTTVAGDELRVVEYIVFFVFCFRWLGCGARSGDGFVVLRVRDIGSCEGDGLARAPSGARFNDGACHQVVDVLRRFAFCDFPDRYATAVPYAYVRVGKLPWLPRVANDSQRANFLDSSFFMVKDALASKDRHTTVVALRVDKDEARVAAGLCVDSILTGGAGRATVERL